MLRVVRVPDVLEGRRPGAALADGIHLAGRECHAWHMSQGVAGGARGTEPAHGNADCDARHVRSARVEDEVLPECPLLLLIIEHILVPLHTHARARARARAPVRVTWESAPGPAQSKQQAGERRKRARVLRTTASGRAPGKKTLLMGLYSALPCTTPIAVDTAPRSMAPNCPRSASACARARAWHGAQTSAKPSGSREGAEPRRRAGASLPPPSCPHHAWNAPVVQHAGVPRLARRVADAHKRGWGGHERWRDTASKSGTEPGASWAFDASVNSRSSK